MMFEENGIFKKGDWGYNPVAREFFLVESEGQAESLNNDINFSKASDEFVKEMKFNERGKKRYAE